MTGNTLTADMFTDRDRERFWAKVNVPDHRAATCWEWTAARAGGGYGMFRLAGTTVRATRAAYAMHYGETPGDKLICHMCDNPKCVRRTHLYLGDYADNSTDMVDAGHSRRGEDNGAVLTLDQVNSARRRAAAGDSIRDLAREFGANYNTLRSAVIGRRGVWSEATEPPVDVTAVTERKRGGALDQARVLIAGGASVTAAAREVGVCRRTLYAWLKAAGIPPQHRTYTAEERAESARYGREAMAAGRTMCAAAEEQGVSLAVLQRALKKFPAPAAV